MCDDTRSDLWARSIRRCAKNTSRNVFSGSPSWPWSLEEEGFAAIDRECFDGDHDLVGRGLRLVYLGQSNHIF